MKYTVVATTPEEARAELLTSIDRAIGGWDVNAHKLKDRRMAEGARTALKQLRDMWAEIDFVPPLKEDRDER
jgi:hypothetical protein